MAIPSSQRKKNILWIATAVIVFVVVIVILAMLLNSSESICVSIEPQDIQLELGQTEQLEILSEGGDKLECSTQWSSASPGVATVNKNGLVTAVNAGKTKVTAIVTLKGKDYVVSADVTVIAGASDKVIVSGDKVEDDPEIKGECFTIFSTSEGVTYDMDGGTIDISDDVKQSEIFFAKSQNKPYASAWELRGSVERQSYNQSLFLSFGVKTETGKEQWFCIYEEALSRQRYWNWADSKQSPDGVHVGFNDAAWDFFHRKADNLEYILVLKDDVLKVYMGSNRYAMSLAWSLPLTEEKYGGFEKGTEYIVGVNTVDPCSIAITNISQKNGEDVEDLGGYVSSRYVDSHITGDRFRIDSASTGVSSNASKGTIATHSLVTQTELWFAASRSQKTADAWELTGTVTQEDPTLPLFMSFGVKDQSGKDQWFCILDDALSRQRYWNWWDTKYAVDGIHVFYNQPAYDFYLNLEEAPSLSYRIIVKDDVLYAYFGESADTLQLAWELPLTEELFGGFAEGTKYQLGINTVDPNNLRHEDVLVKIGDEVSTEEIGEKKFIVAEASENLRYSERIGTISYGSQDGTEIYFSADENGSYATKWELTGTITKADNYADVLVSFGVRDTNGIDQWYTIYQHGALVGLAENGTFINSNDTYLTFNQPSCSFYWEEIDNGSQSLDYKIVLENDVLYGYFGNDKYEMTLSWVFPITKTMFGGFNPGTAYQLGIYKQKSCIMQMTNVAVVAEGIVDAPENLNDKFYTAQVSSGVTVYEKAGLIKYSGTDTTELYFGADEDGSYATKWELTGTLTKADNFAELLLSFGVRDTNGKVQWYSIDGNGFSEGLPSSGTFYNEGSISRDNFVFNQAACSFYYCEGNRESDKIHYKIVIENDVLYAYFGNNTYPLTLSWTFPMTDEKFGGLTAGTAYQLGIYTQKPCVMQMTAVAASAEGLVDAPVIEEERSPLYIAGMTDGITYDENAASVSYPAMDEAEIFFAADSEGGYANKWEISGAIYKGQRFNNLMLAFGVKDENGKEQWFAIKDHGFTTDKTASGATIGDPYRAFNQAACSFYWREGNRESDKLYYKIVVKNDVLYSYFGNDTYPMELSWTLDLTEAQFGGFASGSSYQLGVATSGDSSVEIKDMTAVATSTESEEQTQAFYIASVSDGIKANAVGGTLSYPGTDGTEIIFAADKNGGYANKWELTGTVTKADKCHIIIVMNLKM